MRAPAVVERDPFVNDTYMAVTAIAIRLAPLAEPGTKKKRSSRISKGWIDTPPPKS